MVLSTELHCMFIEYQQILLITLDHTFTVSLCFLLVVCWLVLFYPDVQTV